ncbi:hypothetical protein ANN_09212 [Periplaneta americana]|uniref:Reverse transcriptase domain-containing protein n=1 Tax=Periplaneta americana TaxID=6978 RepID=A0ABQ8TP97_PERAM|nr:hypothetical protein ANN_09212 [Periplaneta americana]
MISEDFIRASIRKGSSSSQEQRYLDMRTDLIGNKEDILERWRRHFNDLLNGNNTGRTPFMDTVRLTPDVRKNTSESSPINLEEVIMAVEKLKNNKVSGSDNIPPELLKNGCGKLLVCMKNLLPQIWEKEVFPKEWCMEIICPIHKRGDQIEYSNYRGITLLNTTYKLLSNVLYHRLRPHVEKQLGDYQSGFRHGKSTTNHIFTLRQILEKMREFNVTTHLLFIDFKCAYDSINRKKLYCSMEELNIPSKLINMVMAFADDIVIIGRPLKYVEEAFLALEKSDISIFFDCLHIRLFITESYPAFAHIGLRENSGKNLNQSVSFKPSNNAVRSPEPAVVVKSLRMEKHVRNMSDFHSSRKKRLPKSNDGVAVCFDVYGPFRRYVTSSSVSPELLVILILRCAFVDGGDGDVLLLCFLNEVAILIPTRNTILRWVASFRITGSTLKKKSPGRNSIALRLSEATGLISKVHTCGVTVSASGRETRIDFKMEFLRPCQNRVDMKMMTKIRKRMIVKSGMRII